MKKYLITLSFLVITLNFGFSQEKGESVNSKSTVLKAPQYAKIKKLVESGEFEFVGDWLIPVSSSRISLIGNPNRLIIRGEKANAKMPYFGRLFLANTDPTILFESEMRDYTVAYNDEEKHISIRFNIKTRLEFYKLAMDVFNNGVAELVINSNKRNTISYKGNVKEIEPPQ